MVEAQGSTGEEAEKIEIVLPGDGVADPAAFAVPQVEGHVIPVRQHVPAYGGFYLVCGYSLHLGLLICEFYAFNRRSGGKRRDNVQVICLSNLNCRRGIVNSSVMWRQI